MRREAGGRSQELQKSEVDSGEMSEDYSIQNNENHFI